MDYAYFYDPGYFDFWNAIENLVRVGIAVLELAGGCALLFRFRAHLLHAVPAAMGLATYALLDTISVVFNLAGLWYSSWAETAGLIMQFCTLLATLAILVGLALVGLKTRAGPPILNNGAV
jgi:hypothetical protein